MTDANCNALCRSPWVFRNFVTSLIHSINFAQQPSGTITKKLFCGRIRDTFFTVFLNFETKRLYTIKWKITRAQRKTSLKLISCNSNVKPKSKISCNLKLWVLSRHSLKTMASKRSIAKDNFRTFFVEGQMIWLIMTNDDNWTLQASDLWVSSSVFSLVQKPTTLNWKYKK